MARAPSRSREAGPRRGRSQGGARTSGRRLAREVGLCLVGTGGIAAAHVAALEALGGCRLRWIVARTPESAARFRGEWRFEHATTEIRKPLCDPEVDVVLVASPSPLHAEQASLALGAGKHTIVEIPVALSLEDACRLAEQARSAERRLLVCHTMRSFPAIREVRHRVEGGQLGVSQVSGFFAIPRRENESWAGRRNWIDNLLWHHGCHQVDAAMWVLGIDDAREISAHFGRAHPTFGMVTDVSLSFVSASRQVVSQSLTYNTATFVWELRFVGDEECLLFREGRLLDERGGEIIAGPDIRDLLEQDRQVLATIREDAESDFDIESVLPAMRILHEAQLAAEAPG